MIISKTPWWWNILILAETDTRHITWIATYKGDEAWTAIYQLLGITACLLILGVVSLPTIKACHRCIRSTLPYTVLENILIIGSWQKTINVIKFEARLGDDCATKLQFALHYSLFCIHMELIWFGNNRGPTSFFILFIFHLQYSLPSSFSTLI